MIGGLLSELRDYRRYRRLTDDEWHQMLLDSVAGATRLPMPGFPPEDVQRAFVGQAGTDAIEEAWRFYSLMTRTARKHGLALNAGSHVLDFGCGWGRYARMFLHDVPGTHIWLADTWDRPLEICRETGVSGQRVRLLPMPPSPLPPSRYDLAFAYSVFSHLSPMAHLAWAAELGSSIKPGGLIFVTTQGRWFLDDCLRYRQHPEQRTIRWHDQLANSFIDHDASVAAYDRGEFLFAPNQSRPDDPPELGPDFYGQAVVPATYFEAKWDDFEMLEFVTDRSRCEQAIAILRRR